MINFHSSGGGGGTLTEHRLLKRPCPVRGVERDIK